MTVAEHFQSFNPPVRILATDIDTNVLEKAKQGRYALQQLQTLNSSQIKRYFLKGAGKNTGLAKIRPELRQMITFKRINLLDNSWGVREKFDAVFCRNVMIYFDKSTQYEILRKMQSCIQLHGLFFAGHSENFHHAADLFKVRAKQFIHLRIDPRKKMLRDDPKFADKKYFDRDFDTFTVKILPGEYFATADATAITTLLGSCVSVCLYDRNNGVGGMNHFMLPKILLAANASRCATPYALPCHNPCSARYGECAFKHLMEHLEKLGARRSSLEAKLFGAGRVMAGGTDIGRKNAEFAVGYLNERKIPVVASDLGDCFPRKVIFFPATGRAFIKRLKKEPKGTF